MKHFKILLLIFCVMLSSKLSYAQSKVKCTNCKNGIATWSETVSCTNCKSWADSYRNIKGCDVCKNNEVITIRKQGKCTVCNGTTWRVPVRPAPLTKAQQIRKRLQDLNLYPVEHLGGISHSYNSTVKDVNKSRILYVRSVDNLWYLLAAIMIFDESYSDYKNKLPALLDYYEFMYTETKKSLKESDSPFYPSPSEVALIKKELAKLDLDPNYRPQFFGPSFRTTDILELPYR